MKFLKSAKASSSGFSAQFTNGESTKSHSAAQFFMVMDDRGALADELDGYIHIGAMAEPQNDWQEIKRIAKTFEKVAAK